MQDESVYLVSVGASTAVGRTAWSSAAAVRAAVSGFAQHPYMIDTAGEPMRAAFAPWLDIGLTGVDRFSALLFPAIDQVVESHTLQLARMKVAIAIALPAPRPGLQDNLAQELLAHAAARYPGQFAASATFPHGHAAGLLALDAACRRLKQGTLDACVVAGVDSYIEPQTLEWLERCEQLHGAGPLNNAWGFIPGEAAGALLLVREKALERPGMPVLAQVAGVASAMESKCIKTQTVCIGEGLTQAFRAALQVLPQGMKVTDVYCDMNGEPYRADEYGFTCLRTKEYFESASDLVAPADCWGDVAAAGPPLHIGLAAIAGAKGYANGETAFVWASSEQGQRAATVLRIRMGARDAS